MSWDTVIRYNVIQEASVKHLYALADGCGFKRLLLALRGTLVYRDLVLPR